MRISVLRTIHNSRGFNPYLNERSRFTEIDESFAQFQTCEISMICVGISLEVHFKYQLIVTKIT